MLEGMGRDFIFGKLTDADNPTGVGPNLILRTLLTISYCFARSF